MSHAKGQQGRENLHRDQAQDGRQGEGGADSAGADGLEPRDRKAAQGKRLPSKAPAKPANLGKLTEQAAKEALVDARGDLFIASQLLGITAIRLNRAIAVSPVLQSALDVSKMIVPGVPLETIHKAIEERVALYRVSGLDALHDLATMPIDVNSAQNQVKLAAAARLAGTVEGQEGGSDLAETLRELQRQYDETAPRLRVTRERVTIERLPPERVVGPTSDQSK